ncbi:MAG: hypothetical protein FWE88_05560 [Phycisphaerae bacterium]|nr:hypothetical protein [Phycisphaerae bacterium]
MSNLSINLSTTAVPQTIVDVLQKTIRRTRMVIAIKGACATLAVAVAGLLAAMAVDAGVVIFSAWPRWTLSLTVLGLAMLTAAVMLVRPLVKSFSLAGMARLLESKHPEMQERLSSAVQLLTSRDAPEIRGSEQLIAALAMEATDTAAGVQPRREVSLAAARPYLLAAGIVLAILASLFVLWPETAATLLKRAVAPNADIPNLRAADLIVTPGQDMTIAQGERLPVSVVVKNSRVGTASIRWIGVDGREHIEPMSPQGDDGGRRFAFTFPPAEDNFRYRVHAGDALSQFFNVTVVAKPQARSVVIRYEYLPYTQLPPAQESGMQIKAVAGTLAKVTLVANKPLKEASLVIESSPRIVLPRAEATDRDSATFMVPLTPKLQGDWHIELTDELGFRSIVGPYPAEAVDDQPPVVKIVKPEKSTLTLPPTDRLQLGFTITDDFGVAEAEILVKADSHTVQLAPVPLLLPAAANRLVADTAVLDLSRFDLRDVRTLTVTIRAADRRPASLGGPNEGVSNAITINLDANSPTYATQIQLADELVIRQVLEKVYADLTEAKKESSALYKVMPNLEELNAPAVEKIDRLRGILDGTEQQLRELIMQISGGTYAPLADTLASLVRNHIAIAGSEASKLKLADSKDERVAGSDIVDGEVDRSLAIVGDLLKKLAVMTEEAKKLQELFDLAQQQQELADQKAALDAERDARAAAADDESSGAESQPADDATARSADPNNPLASLSDEDLGKAEDQWAARQAAMAKKLAELSQKTPGALGKRARTQEERARNLIGDARRLSQKQSVVANETAHAAQITEVDRHLKALADRQTGLMEEARPHDATKMTLDTMAEAAEAMKKPDADTTFKKHAEIQEMLKKEGEQTTQGRAAHDFTQQLKQWANRQAEISKIMTERAEAGAKATEAAAAAEKVRQEQVAEAEKLTAERNKKLAELQARQQELHKQSQELEKQSNENNALAPARDVRPSGAMGEAAGHMANADTLPHSLGKATQAANEAKAFADKAAAAAESAKKTAEDPNASEAAGKESAEAKAGSEAAGKAVTEAKAAQAEREKDSAKAADAAKAAGEKSAAAKTAAEAAKAAQAERAQKSTEAANAANAAQQPVADAEGASNNATNASAAKAAESVVAAQKSADADAAAKQARADADAAKAANAEDAGAKEEAAKAAAEQSQASAVAAKAAADAAAEAKGAAEKATAAHQEALLKAAQAKSAAGDASAAAETAAKAVQAADEAHASAEKASGESQQAAAAAKGAVDQAVAAVAQAENAAKAATEKFDATKKKVEDVTANREKLAKDAAAAAETAKAVAKLAEDQAAVQKALTEVAEGEVKKLAEAREAANKANAEKDAQTRQAAEAAHHVQQQAGNQEQVLAHIRQIQAAVRERASPAAKEVMAESKALATLEAALNQARQGKLDEENQPAKAAEELKELAAAMEKALGEKPVDAGAHDHAMRQIQHIANKQAQIAAETKQHLDRRAQLVEQQKQAHLARLTAEQAELSAQIAKVSDQYKELSPQEDRLDFSVARSAVRADENLRQRNMPEAIREAATTGERLEQLANRLGATVKQPEKKPEADKPEGEEAGKPADEEKVSPAVTGSTALVPDQLKTGETLAEKREALGEETAKLAERQQQLARELEAADKGRINELVESRQADVKAAADDLADDVKLVRDYSGDLVPDPNVVKNAAEQAHAHMKAVQESQATAAKQLAENAPQQAVGHQQHSEQKLNEAAAALEHMANQLNAVAGRDPAPQDPEAAEESGHLADATDEATEAAIKRELSQAEQAAKMLEQMTQAAAARAQQLGVMPQSMANAMQQARQSAQTEGGMSPGQGQYRDAVIELSTAELQKMGYTIGDWGLLKGELRSQVLQAAGEKSPEEYKQMIRDYFEAVSSRGVATSDK